MSRDQRSSRNPRSSAPSLYPKPAQHDPQAPYHPSASSELPSHPSVSLSGLPQEPLAPGYELLLEIRATVTELNPPSKDPVTSTSSFSTAIAAPIDGMLRIIQGPLPPPSPEQTTSSYFHAFLSIGSLNIPLLPACIASRPGPSSFTLAIPHRAFALHPHTATERELLDSLERLLCWFCRWDAADYRDESAAAHAALAATAEAVRMAAKAEAAMNGEGIPEHTLPPEGLNTSQKNTADRFASVGDKGVEMVDKLGDAIHRKLTARLEASRDAAGERDSARDIKLGGRVTSGVLTTTRKVVGVGANVASRLSDRISTAVGTRVLSDNTVSRSMATAQEGTFKREAYDTLMAGLVVVGRLFVAVDEKGKKIIEDVGDRSAEVAELKYGSEAANASRNVAGIALDGYRISRFPQKLGATAILRGAVKSQVARAGRSADLGGAAAEAGANRPQYKDPVSISPGVSQGQWREVSSHPSEKL